MDSGSVHHLGDFGVFVSAGHAIQRLGSACGGLVSVVCEK